MADVTQILAAAAAGDPKAAAELLPLVYDELRKLAAARLAEEKPGQTLQPTALVHEAYLRLVGGDQPRDWNGRGHFFAAAAEAMRRILVEAARRKQGPGGAGTSSAATSPDHPAEEDDSERLLALDEALTDSPPRAPRRRARQAPVLRRPDHPEAAAALASRPEPPTATGPTPGPGSSTPSATTSDTSCPMIFSESVA